MFFSVLEIQIIMVYLIIFPSLVDIKMLENNVNMTMILKVYHIIIPIILVTGVN